MCMVLCHRVECHAAHVASVAALQTCNDKPETHTHAWLAKRMQHDTTHTATHNRQASRVAQIRSWGPTEMSSREKNIIKMYDVGRSLLM